MPVIKETSPRTGKVSYTAVWLTPTNSKTKKRGFRTRRDATNFLTELESSKLRGSYVNPTAGGVTVGELGAEWLATQTNLKPSYQRTIESAWRIRVEPLWGARPIGGILRSEVTRWVADMTVTAQKNGKPLSTTSILRAHGILASILDVALEDNLLAKNVARGMKNLPKFDNKRHNYLTEQQVELLATEARAYATLVNTLAYTGLRWGEAIGLRVSDLDHFKRELHVNENAVTVGSAIVVGSPKNSERRIVSVAEFLITRLDALCLGKRPEDLIFGSGLEHLKHPDGRKSWWAYAKRRAIAIDDTIPASLTMHDLRHTAASLMIRGGNNVLAVQKQLGHKSAAMTLDRYADLFPDDRAKVGKALDLQRREALGLAA